MSLGRRARGSGLGPGVAPGAVSGGRGAPCGPGTRLPARLSVGGAPSARCVAKMACCCQCLLSPSGMKGDGHKLKHKFHLSMRKNCLVLRVALE